MMIFDVETPDTYNPKDDEGFNPTSWPTHGTSVHQMGVTPLCEPANDASLKPSNPKDMIGVTKAALHLWPMTATLMGSLALTDGALKYGRANWRVAGVRASIYKDAADRHLARWFEGENCDPDSGLPHLAHVLACIAILVDADAAGMLTDDRQVQGGFCKLLEEMTPKIVELQNRHFGKNPKHYTIQDNARPGLEPVSSVG